MRFPCSALAPRTRIDHRPARMNHRPARGGTVPSYFPPLVPSPTCRPKPQCRRITRGGKAPTNNTSSLGKFFASFITKMREKRLLIRDNEADELVVESIWMAYEVLHRQNVTVAGLRDVTEKAVVRLGVAKWIWGYVREEALEWWTDEEMEHLWA